MGRSNPQTSFFVVEESSDFVVNNTGRVLLIVTVGHEVVTVVAVHPIVGAQPNKAFFVLDNTVDLRIGYQPGIENTALICAKLQCKRQQTEQGKTADNTIIKYLFHSNIISFLASELTIGPPHHSAVGPHEELCQKQN